MYPRIGTPPHVLNLYMVCAGLGLAAVVWLTLRQLKSLPNGKQLENRLMICIPGLSLCGVFCAFWLDAVFHRGLAGILQPRWGGGLTFYGWLIGAILFLRVYSWTAHVEYMTLLNLFLPAFAPAQAFGRIGCFLGGCCYGKPGGGWIGVCYPEGSLAGKTYGNQPLYPVQLLEAGLLFLLGWFLFRRVRFEYRGAFYLLMLGLIRFPLEFLRGDSRGKISGLEMLSPAQWISIVCLLAGISLIIRLYRWDVKGKSEQTI